MRAVSYSIVPVIVKNSLIYLFSVYIVGFFFGFSKMPEKLAINEHLIIT